MLIQKPQTRADYVLLISIAVGLVLAIVSVIYLVVSTDFVHWDLREHPESARFTLREPEPVGLMPGMYSYQGVREVTDLIQQGSGLPVETYSSRTLPNAKYPQRDLVRLVVRDYGYCDTAGELTLRFFNDRLMEAIFLPVDVGACLEVLKRSYPELRRDHNGRALLLAKDLRLYSNLELTVSEVGQALQTQPYISWQDLRLMQQLEEWEARFAAQAQLKPN